MRLRITVDRAPGGAGVNRMASNLLTDFGVIERLTAQVEQLRKDVSALEHEVVKSAKSHYRLGVDGTLHEVQQ
jgi:hypothetical protein